MLENADANDANHADADDDDDDDDDDEDDDGFELIGPRNNSRCSLPL